MTWDQVEIAAGRPFGRDAVEIPQVSGTPRSVLEDVIRPALERPPCVVAFSGGRDSSAVLAVAVALARREGLEQPIALTRVHPTLPETDERAWQEGVARTVGLATWETLTIDDELDVIGPWARPLLRRFGPLWPPVAHSYVPLLDAARGGSLLTGEGGDTVFGPQRGSWLLRALRRRQRVTPALLQALAETAAPAPVRRRAIERSRRTDRRATWLTPEAAEAVLRLVVDDDLTQPWDWARSVAWHLGDRGWCEGAALLEELAAGSQVQLVHPLSEPALLAALRPAAGVLGFVSRGDAMVRFFGDLLPEDILRRTSKARFDRAVFSRHARAFAASWDGTASYDALVVAEALRAEWLSPSPTPLAIVALQQAWLGAAAREDEIDRPT